MKRKRKSSLSTSDKLIMGSGYVLLAMFVLVIIIPLIYVVVASFMDPTVLNKEGISFNFSKWSLEGYKRVFNDNMILRGFINSIFYSISFAVISVAATLLAAYPLSKQEFVGRKFINTLWWRFNAYVSFNGQAIFNKYALGNNITRCNKCMEYNVG